MKYSAVILSFALGVFALPQEASSVTTPAPSAPSVSFTPQQTCAAACADDDVTCKAECFGVARPNTSQILETTQCAMDCDQGSGSPEDTKAYGDCQQACYAKYFPSSQTLGVGGPAPASSAGGAAPTGSDGAAAPTGASQSPTGTGAQASGSGTPTGSAAGNQPTGAASSNKVQLAGAGIAGLAMAIFAL